jgi:hypothetical protein
LEPFVQKSALKTRRPAGLMPESGAPLGTAAVRLAVDVAVCAAGLLVASLEGHLRWPGGCTGGCTGAANRRKPRPFVAAAAVRECRLLGTAWGRGLVYMFLASVALSRVSLEKLANVLEGFGLLAVGAANVWVGCALEAKLRAKVEGPPKGGTLPEATHTHRDTRKKMLSLHGAS